MKWLNFSDVEKMDEIVITSEAPRKMQFVIEYLAIEHGVTKDQMFRSLIYESESFINELKEMKEDSEEILRPKIETKEEFDKRFRCAIQDTVKNKVFSDNEISILKKAYYFSQMAEYATVPQPKPHDKARYKKYENAINTIDEMLTISNHIDTERLLRPLQETYNLLIKSKMDLKNHYKQKRNEELTKINLSDYAKKDIIESFKKSI